MINPHSSGVCVLGTRSCVMKHTGIVERDKRIAELEEALEKSLTDCQDCMAEQDQQIAKLVAENERLRPDAERYRCWKQNGLSYSDGFYQLELYMYNPDGICEYRDADDVADAAREGK